MTTSCTIASRSRWIAALFGVALAGCGQPAPELAVNLTTDYRPGIEFDSVHTIVSERDDEMVYRQSRGALASGYLEPKRVAEFAGLARGDYSILVELRSGTDQVLAVRRVLRRVDSDVLVPVVITSDCADVTCPAGDARATECLGGRCVRPGCVDGTEPACPESECESDTDCAADVPCAEPVCARTVCLQAPVDERCAPSEVCNVREGCRSPVGDGDGGMRDAGSPDVDAGASDAGPSCTSETCTPLTGCQTAHCDGDTCVRESTCTAEQTCCAGLCVPVGCDDDVACTHDSCGADGCEHEPDGALCEDGIDCTNDVCNADGCDHVPDHSACPEGSGCIYYYCSTTVGCTTRTVCGGA